MDADEAEYEYDRLLRGREGFVSALSKGLHGNSAMEVRLSGREICKYQPIDREELMNIVMIRFEGKSE
jgi:hypothetical protein